MPQGRHTSLKVCLTPQERQTLQTWQRSIAIPSGLARRGRILLLLEEGQTITQVAHTVGIRPRHVSKWVKRFLAQGLQGLVDRPRHRTSRRQQVTERA